jgi:hypothetical protein
LNFSNKTKIYNIKIQITKEDIFYYVAGISSYDALERVLDPTRYELYPDAIWDKTSGKWLSQESDYVYYYSHVNRLKEFSPKMQADEIRRLCEEIAEIAPKEINV